MFLPAGLNALWPILQQKSEIEKKNDENRWPDDEARLEWIQIPMLAITGGWNTGKIIMLMLFRK
jgi:hypothetical protein